MMGSNSGLDVTGEPLNAGYEWTGELRENVVVSDVLHKVHPRRASLPVYEDDGRALIGKTSVKSG
jgi:hypothetical protein